ncbi:MAG TPA: FAD binding domain-containing protein [Acidiphilium sp.]
MKSAAFSYHAPKSVEAAVALLGELAPEGARILAGGQSLVPIMAFRLAQPAHLIDINRIAALTGISVSGTIMTIGAATRHAAFERPPVPGAFGALLADICHNIAHGPIRTRGTFGGSISHADPASEWCLLAATLGATMIARSPRGERRIPASAFFEGIMTTSLAADELLTAIELSVPPAGTHMGFYEYSRRHGDFAIGMTLATFRIEAGRIADPRIGLGGIEPVPRRCPEAEAALLGREATEAAFAAAAEAAREAVDPMEDGQIDAEYRRDVIAACIRRALLRCAA